MSVVNEINVGVVQAVAGSNAPKTDRGDASQVRAAEVRQVQEHQARDAAARSVAEQVTPGSVNEAVSAINAQVQRVSQNLRFSVDQDSGRVVVKVVDGETDQVIRQIPSEEALAISHSLDKLQGLIIQQKA